MTVSNSTQTPSPFQAGSTWLRADFHLHTRADQEFSYQGESDRFVTDYVEALEQADIRLGVITNHNKFDLREFKALRKKARKKGISLLPGVELSVSDGASGVHMLVVYSEAWIDGPHDYINAFIQTVFPGISPTQYEQENGQTSQGIGKILDMLENLKRDFFVVFAHVDSNKGLLEEMGGARLMTIGKEPLFRRNTLGLQKVRKRDLRKNVQNWFGDWYPAEVEGSDPKSVEDIGRGDSCYLKLGDGGFQAVKFALIDPAERVWTKRSAPLPQVNHSHLQEIYFEGGALDGRRIPLSPGLNCLIGIRGSGKSSILESIRYGLNIPVGEKSLDKEYKNGLPAHTWRSGGRLFIVAQDRQGQNYEVRRILGECSDIYVDGTLQPGVAICDTVIHKPLYFGQKDLSSTGEGFEKDLVEKLVGERLRDVRNRTEEQRVRVDDAIDRLQRLSNIEEKRSEYLRKDADAEFRLGYFRKHGVEEKLRQRIDFDRDQRRCADIGGMTNRWLSALEELLARFEDDFANHRRYHSRVNEEFFKSFFTIYDRIHTGLNEVKRILEEGRAAKGQLDEKQQELKTAKEQWKEEFARIERDLTEKLTLDGKTAIRPNEFVQLTKTRDQARQMLAELDKQAQRRSRHQEELSKAMTHLNDLWLEEFRIIQQEVDKINSNSSSLAIQADFKGDKMAMASFMKEIFRGSRLREAKLQELADTYSDFGAIYRDLDQAAQLVGSNRDTMKGYFMRNLKELLTWQVPNRFLIRYHDKLLKDHSLGQRASALILFILAQGENNLVLIDQPEDDLDNQTIYEDVIKLVRKMKTKTQFIFATHNANFPVLGDADQVITCRHEKDRIIVDHGSIDRPKIQQAIIEIMEGGQDAFQRRKEIYHLWNPRN